MGKTQRGTAANQAAAATTEEKAKRTRTVLTPAQRIEKAKADLAALEAKEAKKAEAKVATLTEKRKALMTKVIGINAEIASLTEEINTLSPAEAEDTGVEPEGSDTDES